MRAYYENKVAAITGAASGIGLAITELLLKNGATVFMADVNAEALRQQADRLNGIHPGKAKTVVTVGFFNFVYEATSRFTYVSACVFAV